MVVVAIGGSCSGIPAAGLPACLTSEGFAERKAGSWVGGALQNVGSGGRELAGASLAD